jgi:hypothetical protein
MRGYVVNREEVILIEPDTRFFSKRPTRSPRSASASPRSRVPSRSSSATSTDSAPRRCRASRTRSATPARRRRIAKRRCRSDVRTREEARAPHPSDRAQDPRGAEGLPEVRQP